MQRRDLLRFLGSSTAVALSGCANGNPELLRTLDIPPEAFWNQLPTEVRNTFSTHPALQHATSIGVTDMSVPEGSQGEILTDWHFDPVGPLYCRRSALRTQRYTRTGGDGDLRHPLGFGVCYLTTDYDEHDHPNGLTDNSYTCTGVVAEGAFAMRPGAESKVDLSITNLDRQGNLTNKVSLKKYYTRVEQKIDQVDLWTSLIHGRVKIDPPPWLLFEESFLMGNYFKFIQQDDDEAPRTMLYSEVYGLLTAIRESNNSTDTTDTYGTTGLFGAKHRDIVHIKGGRFALNLAGEARLRDARIALEAELYRMVAAGSVVSRDRQAAAVPILAHGRELWTAQKWGEAVTTLGQGLELDPRHPASLVLYADALRRAFPRPSAQSVAADRLARLNLRTAAALDPDGAAGQAAKSALSTITS